MILEYRCSNFKSIKDEVVFSMLASSDNSHSDKLIDFNNLKLNKVTAIYGANGSGKSSFFESFLFLSLLVSGRFAQPDEKINIYPHALSDEGTPSEFLIQFVKNNVRYAYGISLTRDKIVREFLYHFKSGRKAKVFDREGEEYSFGKNYKNELEKFITTNKENRSFVNTVAYFSKLEEIKDVFKFFKDDLVVYSPSFMNNWKEYSFEKINDDYDFKNKVIKTFNNLGVDVKDIRTESFKIPIFNELNEDISPERKEILKKAISNNKNFYVNKVFFDYGMFSVDLDNESNGIKRLFEVLCPLLDIITNNKILIWDEIETGLHSSILDTLIKLFINKEDSNAQLIFTTHDISLLNLDILRRDQIWFTELDMCERKTDLYSLSDFKNIRKTDNVSKNYIEGRYGAIPFIKTTIQSVNEEV